MVRLTIEFRKVWLLGLVRCKNGHGRECAGCVENGDSPKEKWDQNVFVMSPTQLGRFRWIPMKFGTYSSFRKQLAAKRLNVFHLTWVMSLHYLVKLKSAHRAHWIIKERNSIIYSTLTVASISPDLNPTDYRVWGILQENVFKLRITDLDELKQRPRTRWTKLDYVVIAAAIRQWRRGHVMISDACFRHVLSQYSHTL